MDLKKIREFEVQYDKAFAEKHMDFVVWWAGHRHNDPDPKYAVAPRVAYKCACFYDEFWNAKQVGAV